MPAFSIVSDEIRPCLRRHAPDGRLLALCSSGESNDVTNVLSWGSEGCPGAVAAVAAADDSSPWVQKLWVIGYGWEILES